MELDQLDQICLACGNSGPLYDNMCETCFRTTHKATTLPVVLKMKICSRCNYMVNTSSNLRVASWEKGIPILVEEALETHAEASPARVDVIHHERNDYFMDLEVQVECEIMGLQYREAHTPELRISYGVCNRCSRQFGNYYEAIIQLRGGKRPISARELDLATGIVQKRIEESTGENAFITQFQEIHKGLDWYMGDKGVAKEIARELQRHFGAEFQETYSLAGRKDGKEIYRSTYLVRLPDYRAGDLITYEDKVHLLKKTGDRSATLLDLIQGTTFVLKERELHKIKVIKGDVLEAVVVSSSKGEAQLLDPVNYRTKPVRTPIPLKAGETVKVFRYEGDLFILPSDP